MKAIRIGCSGWNYRHWRGRFYPAGLPQRDWLAFYATHFDTVEINNSFYRLPSAETFAKWRDQAPPGFCYSVKGRSSTSCRPDSESTWSGLRTFSHWRRRT